MDHTRSVHIPYLHKLDIDHLRSLILQCCFKGGTHCYIESTPNGSPAHLRVRIDIWGNNPGSVDALHDQVLVPLTQDASATNITFRSMAYIKGVEDWLKAERQ